MIILAKHNITVDLDTVSIILIVRISLPPTKGSSQFLNGISQLNDFIR